MNIEELTKSQLLLLTVLVTFVTSIATGILTVSLLDQASPTVMQNVNQIVERTVKTVAPTLPTIVTRDIAPAPAPSDEDRVTAALAAQDARIVLIYKKGASTSTPATAVGTYLSGSRVVVTAAIDALPADALIEFPNGAVTPATYAGSLDGLSRYDFAAAAELPNAINPRLVPRVELRLGQTVLAIRGDGSATTGIISRASAEGIRTTLPSVGGGVGAVDLSGNLVGIASGDTKGTFFSADTIVALLAMQSGATASTSSKVLTQ